MKLGVTGHRPGGLPCGYDKEHAWKEDIEDKIWEFLKEHNPEIVLTGMALGFDQWVAQACIDAGTPFHAVLPFKGQETIWNDKAIEYYNELLGQAKEVTYITNTYNTKAFFDRDKYIANNSDEILALYDGRLYGGTYYTVVHAARIKKKITNLWPNNQ